MRRTLHRLVAVFRRRRPEFLARSPRHPLDSPTAELERRQRWFTTGEIRRNRRESW